MRRYVHIDIPAIRKPEYSFKNDLFKITKRANGDGNNASGLRLDRSFRSKHAFHARQQQAPREASSRQEHCSSNTGGRRRQEG